MLNPVADPMRWDDRARQWWVFHALSNAHDLLMASDWKGANLEALIKRSGAKSTAITRLVVWHPGA
jgi:hypothetical protein